MYVSRPYRVGIIAALALLCMAPDPAAARTSEKSPKTPEIAGDIAAVALPAAGLIVSLAVGDDRQGVKQLALACAADLAVGGRVEIRDRQIPAGRTRRAGLPVHSLGGRLRRSIVYPTTLRLEIRSPGLRAGRLCRLEPHRSRRAKTRHLGRARRSGFGSGLRLPVYEALPQTENIVRRRSDRFGRRMCRSPRRPRVLSHPSANGQIGHVRRAAQCQRSSIEPFQKRISGPGERLRTAVHETDRVRASRKKTFRIPLCCGTRPINGPHATKNATPSGRKVRESSTRAA